MLTHSGQASTGDMAGTGRPDRRLLAAAIASKLLLAACVGLPSVMLVEIGETFGLDNAHKGLIASLRSGTVLPAVLLAGLAADRLGKRWLLLGGAAAMALGLVLTGFAPKRLFAMNETLADSFSCARPCD